MSATFQNKQGIDFPSVESLYTEGEIIFNRYITLTAREASSPILSKEKWGQKILARDRFNNELVVANKLHEEYASDLIIDQISELTKLNHANLESVQDLVHEERKWYFITPYYTSIHNLERDRHTLSTRRDNLYEVKHLQQWLKDLCPTLKYLHDDKSFLHGSLTAKNLYLTDYGQDSEKLILGGLYENCIYDSSLPEAYYSPQMADGKPYGLNDEIYALGVTLFSIITESPPTRRESTGIAPESARSRLDSKGIDNYRIPQSWDTIISKCLNPKTKFRPSSVSEIESYLFPESQATFIPPPPEPQQLISEEEKDTKSAELEEKIEDLRGENESLKNEHSEAQSTIEQLKSQLSDTEANYQAIAKSTDNKDVDRIDELQKNLNTTKDELHAITREKNQLARDTALIRAESDELRSRQTSHSNEISVKESKIKEVTEQNKSYANELEKLQKGIRPTSSPILLTLLGCLLLGLGGGYYYSTRSNSNSQPTYSESALEQFTPKDKGEASELVSESLFYSFLNTSGFSDEQIPNLIPTLSVDKSNSNTAVSGVSYWMAERFCSWLTQHALSDEQIKNGFFIRIPDLDEAKGANTGAPTTSPEWTSTPKLTSNTAGTQYSARMLYQDPSTSDIYWQIPTQNSSNEGKPLSFRVILDQIQ